MYLVCETQPAEAVNQIFVRQRVTLMIAILDVNWKLGSKWNKECIEKQEIRSTVYNYTYKYTFTYQCTYQSINLAYGNVNLLSAITLKTNLGNKFKA